MDVHNCGNALLNHAFGVAVDEGLAEVAAFFLRQGADVNFKDDKTNRTPLIRACENGNMDLVNLLIVNNPYPNSSGIDGCTALHVACRNGKMDVLEKLLDMEDININSQSLRWETPLIVAAQKNHIEAAAALLLSNSIHVNSKDRVGFTALHRASERNYVALVELLLKHETIDVNVQNQFLKTPLILACRAKHNDVLKALLRHQDIDIGCKDAQFQTPLDYACQTSNESLVHLLVDAGAEVDQKTGLNRSTALKTACLRRGAENIVKFLLEKGADMSLKDTHGWNALMHAADTSRCENVQMLLEYGSHTPELCSMALPIACRHTINTEILRKLLDHGADVNSRDRTGQTALMHSSHSGSTEAVRLLLKHKADPNLSYTSIGWTALVLACSRGHEPVVSLLLNNGADVDALLKSDSTMGPRRCRAGTGWTALFVVCDSSCRSSIGARVEVAKVLLTNGADVNLTDRQGRTPLMHAAQSGEERLVKLLLEYGADPHVQDKNGRTALALASDKGNDAVLQLLLDHGSNTSGKIQMMNAFMML